jgi:phosphoribosylamine-glycine ligase
MRILVVGAGGREHAILNAMYQSELTEKLFCAPGNAGTAEVAQNLPIDVTDIEGIVQAAKDEAIDLTIVGPEVPLALGLVDRYFFLQNHGAFIAAFRDKMHRSAAFFFVSCQHRFVYFQPVKAFPAVFGQ